MASQPAIAPIREETPQEKLRSSLQHLYASHTDAGSLRTNRAKFWDHFLQLGLPERSVESYQYVPLRSLYSGSYGQAPLSSVTMETLAPFVYPECKDSLILLINGQYVPTHSHRAALPPQAIICTITEAIKTYGSFLNNRWAKILKEETDAFAALNGALHGEGVFIYLPPKLKLAAPIQILHLIDTDNQPAILSPRVHVFAGAQSEATFVSSMGSLSGAGYWVNQLHDFAIEEAASINYTSVTDLPAAAWHFDAFRAHLKKDSLLKCTSVTNGAKTARQDYRVYLQGENSEASLNGLYSLHDQRQAHVHVFMEHQAPHCRSFQLFKGVLKDASRSSFEGKIFVRAEAQKTDAFQLNNHLLLSDHAIANSKPNLEIFADDVKASHGSTVGQIDQEHLFYLQARGLSEQESKKLLIQGFTREITGLIPIPSVRQQLEG